MASLIWSDVYYVTFFAQNFWKTWENTSFQGDAIVWSFETFTMSSTSAIDSHLCVTNCFLSTIIAWPVAWVINEGRDWELSFWAMPSLWRSPSNPFCSCGLGRPSWFCILMLVRIPLLQAASYVPVAVVGSGIALSSLMSRMILDHLPGKHLSDSEHRLCYFIRCFFFSQILIC